MGEKDGGKRVVSLKADRPKTGRRGRPPVKLDLDTLRKLCLAGCTNAEIADFLGIARRTLQQRISDDPEVAACVTQAKAERKRNLRVAQTRRALNGSDKMLIHLGEQELGQRRTRAVEVSAPGGGPVVDFASLVKIARGDSVTLEDEE